MIIAVKIILLVLAIFFALAIFGAKDKMNSYLYGGISIILFVLLIVCIKIL